ncbi:unnamed protein product [Lactuca virosa]|uniref:Secreted protein n=1 Tax=Lactuca virosa TaxID=75947 RepID=A0AAU9PUN9_9ASTR|nr:unnamed protein product [Lactuca virosa]
MKTQICFSTGQYVFLLFSITCLIIDFGLHITNITWLAQRLLRNPKERPCLSNQSLFWFIRSVKLNSFWQQPIGCITQKDILGTKSSDGD